MIYERWDETQSRAEIVEVGRRLYNLFLVAANDGNISVRLNDKELLITPTGVSKGFMKAEHILKITPDGEVLSQYGQFRPSSELRLHLAIYRHRPDVRAVVHAHPPTATGFAVAGVSMESVFLPEVAVAIGPTPLVPYATPGGQELADSVVPYLQDHKSLLLSNHGAVTYANDLTHALFQLECMELSARVFLTAQQLGHVNVLSAEQVQALAVRFKL
jgi:L-fuculose-phosphate aldolase